MELHCIFSRRMDIITFRTKANEISLPESSDVKTELLAELLQVNVKGMMLSYEDANGRQEMLRQDNSERFPLVNGVDSYFVIGVIKSQSDVHSVKEMRLHHRHQTSSNHHLHHSVEEMRRWRYLP